MIPLTLAEVAGRRSAGGSHDARTGRTARVTGAVEFDSRRLRPGRPVRRVRRGAGRRARLRGRRGRGRRGRGAGHARRSGVPDGAGRRPAAGDGRAGPGGAGPAAGAHRRRDHRLVRQDHHQGPDRRSCSPGCGPTVAPPGSFNNELGHPYTVLQADRGHPLPGAGDGRPRASGTSGTCAEIAPPRIGVVLNVGVAHIGEFGSVDAIAAGQGRAGRGAAGRRGGGAQRRRPAGARDGRPGPGPGWSWSARPRRATVRAPTTWRLRRARAPASVHAGAPRAAAPPVRLARAPAATRSATRSPAAAVALELGMPLAERRRSASAELRLVSTRRMDVFDRADGVTVIDDSYNANPASTAAALRALAAMRGGAAAGSPCSATWPSSASTSGPGTRRSARLAAELGVDRLVVVGEPAAPIHRGAAAGATGEESRCR